MRHSEDVITLNQTYLLVLRDAAKTDFAQACLQFGVAEELAKKISELSLSEISELAKTNVLLFKTSLTMDTLSNMLRVGDQTRRTVVATLAA